MKRRASTGGIFYGNRSSMRQHQFSDNRQPKAVSFCASGSITLIHSLEYPGLLHWRNSLAVVAHRQAGACLVGRKGNRHTRRLAMHQNILQQVIDNARISRSVYTQAIFLFWNAYFIGDPCVFKGRYPISQNIARQFANILFLEMKDLLPRIQFDPLEKRLDKIAQMSGLFIGNPQIIIALFSQNHACLNRFQISHQGGKRGLHIMGETCHQALICLFRLSLCYQFCLIIYGDPVDIIAYFPRHIALAGQHTAVQVSVFDICQRILNLQ